jgi:hypothetical protein
MVSRGGVIFLLNLNHGFCGVLNMNEGRDSYQTIEVSGGFKPPKVQFFALLTEGKAGKGPG